VSALKPAPLAALLLVGCEPTLYVGEREPVIDAGSPDTPDADADARVRVNDAQQRDGGFYILCRDNRDCPDRLPRCHSWYEVCVQCEFDRDCKNQRCNEDFLVWSCRPDDDGPMRP
jgi:hypothetical protein